MDIFSFLDGRSISYQRHQHPPVFTCEQAAQHLQGVPGQGTKNLFLRDKSGKHHYLVAVPEYKQVDLSRLGEVLGGVRLSFASAERLKRYLGVDPGSVTILGLIADTEKAVEVLIDADLWSVDSWQCHPLVNTETLVIPRTGIAAFLEAVGHPYRLLDVPAVT